MASETSEFTREIKRFEHVVFYSSTVIDDWMVAIEV